MITIDYLMEQGAWPDETVLIDLADKALQQAAKTCATLLPEEAEVSLVFSDDAHVRILNKQWRGQDKPTNVLSFAANEGSGPMMPLLGDIVLAYETLVRESQEQDKNFNEHLTHLLVHGFLHLLGFDHIDDQEAEEMEQLEIKVLALLDIADPYKLT